MHVLAVTSLVEVCQRRHVERAERHGTTGFVLLHFARDGCTQAPVSLILKGGTEAVVEHHLIVLRPLQGYQEVILVGLQETVAG